jgi:HEAT repeat protein
MKAADAVAGLMVLAAEAEESDAQVRAAAVWALGQIGEPDAGDAIREARNDSDPSVRSAANISARLLRL